MGLLERSRDGTVTKCILLLDEALRQVHPRNFSVRLWDGSFLPPEPGRLSRFTLVIRSPAALRTLLLSPNELTLGEAFMYGEIDIEGEIGCAFPLADHLVRYRPRVGERFRWAKALLSLPARAPALRGGLRVRIDGELHSIDRDRKAVTYHYDLSNDFYALWLDRRMVYSCGYFAGPRDDLDTAQERKLDLVCRKLRLRPGERFLDIGCGWGGLLLHAALRYGVEAVGITLSRPQADLAGERIREAGLSGRCRVEIADYREMNGEGLFDKIASVGMVEHVGLARLADYFRQAFRLLRPGGVFLNHGIALNPAYPAPPGPSFSDHYIFPDGEILPLSTMLRVAEEEGFEVRDVECLREHYVRTLTHWRKRLEARADEAIRIVGEPTCRAWRLYLAGAAHTFSVGKNSVHQALLLRPDGGRSGLPPTREDWYGRRLRSC
ncbi:MAG: class I SAM-dependent methyltransferase [Deltaproteobacteria bacterium]